MNFESGPADDTVAHCQWWLPQDTLMAHVDRSEVCATSPLVSIS